MKIEKIEEIEAMWDYPNADNLDWNDAKDTVDFLLSRIRTLEEGIRRHIEAMDKEMKNPSSYTRGQNIAIIVSELQKLLEE